MILSLSLPLSPLFSSSFGLIPGSALAVQSPLLPNMSANTSLPINPGGPVMKMNPLGNLQIAVKDNVDVLYFSADVPMHVLFVEDGNMGKYCKTVQLAYV